MPLKKLLELAAHHELHDGRDVSVLRGATWLGWLNEHRSFAFLGRSGRLSLVKEQRKGQYSYWYAFRRQGKRVRRATVAESNLCPNFCPPEPTRADVEGLSRAANGLAGRSSLRPQTSKTRAAWQLHERGYDLPTLR